MQIMDEKYFTKLETRLEQLVEGVFTQLFRKRISAHDIAIKLARSMEDNLRYIPESSDPRPIAPDEYVIYLHPRVRQLLEAPKPSLSSILTEQLIELAVQSGYRLTDTPTIRVLADKEMEQTGVSIRATHRSSDDHSTAAMQPIPKRADKPQHAHLIVDGDRTVALIEPIINIGRSDDNHIVLDDRFVSRHHVQIRSRFGKHIVFDVNSRAGTFVNNVKVSEHELRAGDVISIGNTRIVYVADTPKNPDNTTSSLDPVDF